MAFRINASFVASATTVSNTATKIPASIAEGRACIILLNNGSYTVYLGGSNVTSATGFPLEAGDSLPIDVGDDIDIFGITANNTAEVRTLEGV